MRFNFPSVLAVFGGLALWLGAATTALADGCTSASRIQQALREVTHSSVASFSDSFIFQGARL